MLVVVSLKLDTLAEKLGGTRLTQVTQVTEVKQLSEEPKRNKWQKNM